jgi:hypothetical protein
MPLDHSGGFSFPVEARKLRSRWRGGRCRVGDAGSGDARWVVTEPGDTCVWRKGEFGTPNVQRAQAIRREITPLEFLQHNFS